MSNKMDVLDMFKQDGVDAGYRVATKQMTKGVKAGIVKALNSKGGKGMRKREVSNMGAFLDTEVGEALIAIGLGMGLTFAPAIKDHPKAKRMAQEFRVGGITQAGNIAMDALMKYVVPSVMETLKGLPEEEVQVRVLDKTVAEVEEVEETEPAKAPAKARL